MLYRNKRCDKPQKVSNEHGGMSSRLKILCPLDHTHCSSLVANKALCDRFTSLANHLAHG